MITKFQITNPTSNDYLKISANGRTGILSPRKTVIIEIGEDETVTLKISADNSIGATIGLKTKKRRRRKKIVLNAKGDTLDLTDPADLNTGHAGDIQRGVPPRDLNVTRQDHL